MVLKEPQVDISSVESDPREVLSQLRYEIQRNPHLNSHQFNDKLLIKFLRAREYKIKRTVETLEGYVEKINKRPELFTWKSQFSEALDCEIFNYYSDLQTNDQQILLLQPGRWDPSKIPIELEIALIILTQEVSLLNENVQKSGFSIIVDMTGLSLNHIYQCGVFNAKLIVELADRCLPVKINNIHIVYQNWLTEMAYNLFKPFINEELRRKIVFHGWKLGKLYQFIPKTALPIKYGGSHEEPDCHQLYKQLERDAFVQTVQTIWSKFKPTSSNN